MAWCGSRRSRNRRAGGVALRGPASPSGTTALERAERARRAPAARAHAEEADAGDRQPVRDDGLRSAQEPRGLRAPVALRGGGHGHRAARARHPACREAAARATTWWWPSAATARSTRPPTASSGRDAAHLPAGRVDQRLVPHARHPERRGGRHRAPAADRGRLPAPPRRPGSGRTSGCSSSRRGSASTRAWSSGWTPTPIGRPVSAPGTTPTPRSRPSAAATCSTRRGCASTQMAARSRP